MDVKNRRIFFTRTNFRAWAGKNQPIFRHFPERDNTKTVKNAKLHPKVFDIILLKKLKKFTHIVDFYKRICLNCIKLTTFVVRLS